jgi:glyoxylate reductase
MVRAMTKSTSRRASSTVSLPLHPLPPIGALTARTGIGVSNTPGAVDDATATTALYLLLSVLRNFSAAERNVRSGQWKAGLAPGRARDAEGRVLGVLGMGGIGRRLAELAHTFPMRVLYHNRRPAADAPAWAKYEPDLHKFLAEVDVLSVHVPLNERTVGLVGERELRAMRQGAMLVNTARGKVVDQDALIRALEDGHVRIGLAGIPWASR